VRPRNSKPRDVSASIAPKQATPAPTDKARVAYMHMLHSPRSALIPVCRIVYVLDVAQRLLSSKSLVEVWRRLKLTLSLGSMDLGL
jgi:hypothetical protein